MIPVFTKKSAAAGVEWGGRLRHYEVLTLIFSDRCDPLLARSLFNQAIPAAIEPFPEATPHAGSARSAARTGGAESGHRIRVR